MAHAHRLKIKVVRVRGERQKYELLIIILSSTKKAQHEMKSTKRFLSKKWDYDVGLSHTITLLSF